MMQLLTRCLLLAGIGTVLPMPTLAQSVPVSGIEANDRTLHPFNIPAQPLASAINAFSRQSGWQISVASELASQRQSRQVIGTLSPEQALTRLLEGTELIWRGTGHNAAVIYSVPAGDALVLEPIQVQGRSSAKDQAYRAAGSVNVIERKEIERFRGTSVGDIFQGTAGVLVGENRNSGGLDLNIRGMQGQGRVPVLVDGARQETTVYRGYSGVSSRSYIDPDLISSVRIEKGPVMTAEGTGATGGVVSMSTLKPSDIIKPGKDWGIRLRGSALGNNSGSRATVGGSSGYNVNGLSGEDSTTYRVDCVTAELCQGPYDLSRVYGPTDTMNRPGLLDMKGWSGSLALAKSFEKLDLVAAYAQRRQGNYYAGKNGPTPKLDLSERYDRGFWTEVRPALSGATRFRAGERIANTHYESRSLLLKSLLYLPADQSLEISWLRYKSVYGEMMPSQLLWLGEIRETEGSRAEANTYTSRYRWQPINTDLIDFKANLWHTDTDQQNANYSNELDFGSDEKENYRRWGSDISNTSRLVAANMKFDYGLAWQDEKLTTRSVNADVSAIPGDTSGRDGQRQEISAFTNMQWKPVASVTIDAGIRYTRFDSKDNKATSVQEGSSFCEDGDGDGECDLLHYKNKHSGSAPLYSITWEPLRGLRFYGRYAEALRMPSLFEGTSGFSTAPALDVNLKPERAHNKEVGVAFLKDGLIHPDDRFRVKLSYFRNRIDDYLTRTSPNVWEEGSGQRFFTTRNIESAEFFGTELSLEYDAGFWYLQASGTRYHHIEMCHYGSYRRDRCTDYGIANSYLNNMIPPNWHASSTLGMRLFKRKLDTGLRATFMGERNRTPEFDDQTKQGFNGPVQWHRYTLLDLYLSYALSDDLTVDFNIDNLTDQYYLDALSLGLVPAPGRSARLSLTWNF